MYGCCMVGHLETWGVAGKVHVELSAEAFACLSACCCSSAARSGGFVFRTWLDLFGRAPAGRPPKAELLL